MILITGASGKTGRTITRVLSKVESVCALVHRAEHVDSLSSLGAAKVVVGDLRDDSLMRAAMNGIRAIYHICPNMSPDELVIGKLAIETARKTEVEHFVYHSVLHPQTEKMNHHWQKMRVEEILFEAGLAFTILQPAPYMQNLLANWNTILEAGVLRVPYSVDSKFSFIDLEDLAEAARIVLTGKGHVNAVYELAGTKPTSYAELATIMGEVMGRAVRCEREEIGDWRLHAAQRNLSNYMIENLVRMFEYYDRWGLAGNPNVLKWVLEREPTSIKTFAEVQLRSHTR